MDEQEQKIWEGLGVTPDEEPEQTDVPGEDDEELDEVDIQDEEDEGGEEEPGEQEEPAEREESGTDPEAAHQQELERVRREGLAAVDAQVAAMGLRNPYDGDKPITTAA